MAWENKIAEWKNEGAEPSEDRKSKGFEAGYKPPAGIFNWFWHKVTKCINEIQTKLDKVDNTPDSEKKVSFASEAGHARKVDYELIIRINGGKTEGTDLFTYNGSTSRSVNLTPKKLGILLDDVGETEDKKLSRLVVATKGADTENAAGGIISNYTATVDGVTELYNGLEITIIPDAKCTAKLVTLNINNLGAKDVRQPLSFSTYVANSPDRDGFIYANVPVRLMYHATYGSNGIWLMADKQKTSAQDLYGTVPIDGGGTGASTAEQALENLGVTAMFENIGNLYVWNKYTGNPTAYSSGSSACITIYEGIPNIDSRSIQYADSVVCEDAKVSLVDPETLHFWVTTECDVLKGKYIQLDDGSIWKVFANATITQSAATDGSGKTTFSLCSANPITANASKVGYITSWERDTYPDNGANGSYWYTYKKQLGD